MEVEEKFYIDKISLDFAKNVLLDYNREACGFLLQIKKQEPNSLSLYIDSYGENIQDRGSCRHSRYETYIFHTHPKISKSYPSWEDVAKIIKYRQDSVPLYSIVFTTWGLWELSCFNKMEMGEKEKAYIQKSLKYCVEDLYKTTGGRENVDTKLVQEFTTCFLKQIRKMNNSFNIYFTPWSHIIGDYFFQ